MELESEQSFLQKYGDHYIAVNEDGKLRSKHPMWRAGKPYSHAFKRPINAGIDSNHIVFFIHGGLNTLQSTVQRIQSMDKEFRGEPYHLVHLAWDTSLGSSIDDMVAKMISVGGMADTYRALLSKMPWNWSKSRSPRYDPIAYFGGVVWKSQYDTALSATSKPKGIPSDRNAGFYRAFEHLNRCTVYNPKLRISFVVHSAGSIVSNYLIRAMKEDFPELATRVSNYILLAPACHITQFTEAEQVLSRTKRVVLSLGSEFEQKNYSSIYSKSILWAVYDMFESAWGKKDFERYTLPFVESSQHNPRRNRYVLGLDEQVQAYDKAKIGKGIYWASTGQKTSIKGTKRVWTNARTHSEFISDPTTIESLKILLS